MAIADFNKAIELDPKYALALYNRGSAYYRKDKYDLAIADFNKAIVLDPKYAPFFVDRGDAYNSKGEYDRAIADFDKAIELDPKFIYAFVNRGNSYYKKGEYSHAIADYNKAIELNSEHAKAFYNRAISYDGKGEYSHAIADYSSAIKLDQENIYEYLNRYLDETRIGKDGTKELAQGTRQLEKNWPYPIIDFYLGKIDKQHLESMANDKIKQCEFAYYIGEWESMSGDKKKGDNLIQKAANTCSKSSTEYDQAIAELRR